ncbi:hypothetical protein [Cupriavidus pinatubonensis]|uniref:hypothetical protein n=1 Tax=Cupriavidus pinatubonensis TaxID=248026 RepID=UPI0036145A51
MALVFAGMAIYAITKATYAITFFRPAIENTRNFNALWSPWCHTMMADWQVMQSRVARNA